MKNFFIFLLFVTLIDFSVLQDNRNSSKSTVIGHLSDGSTVSIKVYNDEIDDADKIYDRLAELVDRKNNR